MENNHAWDLDAFYSFCILRPFIIQNISFKMHLFSQLVVNHAQNLIVVSPLHAKMPQPRAISINPRMLLSSNIILPQFESKTIKLSSILKKWGRLPFRKKSMSFLIFKKLRLSSIWEKNEIVFRLIDWIELCWAVTNFFWFSSPGCHVLYLEEK